MTLSTCQLNRATIRVQCHMYRGRADFLRALQSLSLMAASLIDESQGVEFGRFELKPPGRTHMAVLFVK